jgi:hypothetical protein
LLWGTKRTWGDSQQSTDERRSVLVSVDISSQLIPDANVQSLQLRKGRLVASPAPSSSLAGVVLQGSYMTGALRLRALRERVRTTKGESFDLKAFHRAVLSHGSLPLELLERVVAADLGLP